MKTKQVILSVFVILILVAAFAGWNLFGPTIKNPDKKFLYIKTNSSYQNVKDSLLENNMISGTFWFDKVAAYADYPTNSKSREI